MQRLNGLSHIDDCRGGYFAIGNFDGVHLGHQRMIASLVQHARVDRSPAVVLTFDPHPIEVLRPYEAPARLCTTETKLRLLERFGVDCVIVYPTDHALLGLTPDEFFKRIVRGTLAARGLVEGPNFYFGKDRTGDVGTLRALCDASGLALDVVPPVTVDGKLVSSSAIRRAIAAGDVASAAAMLGRHYSVEGTVVEGAGRGRELGYPTANLARVPTLLPADGVYAGVARVDESSHPAAVNLGPNPTFGQHERKLEVHLLAWDGPLYDRTLELAFLKRLRDTRPFADADELRRQLQQDVTAVRLAVSSSDSIAG